jgi:hypothetical protein
MKKTNQNKCTQVFIFVSLKFSFLSLSVLSGVAPGHVNVCVYVSLSTSTKSDF